LVRGDDCPLPLEKGRGLVCCWRRLVLLGGGGEKAGGRHCAGAPFCASLT